MKLLIEKVQTFLADKVSLSRLPNTRDILFASCLCVVGGNVYAGEVTGDLTKWHPLTVSFSGPNANETDNSPNPFLDYRLQVTFTGPSGQSYQVPGFFDGNGTGGSNGNVWRVRFSPDQGGNWTYNASLRSGSNVAIELGANAGSQVSLPDSSGTFFVADLDTNAPGFLKLGRLEYTNKHYLKFRDGNYWIKGGVDSPENFLGFASFDNTVDQSGGAGTNGLQNGLHRYPSHVNDWNQGDPNFFSNSSGGDGKAIIGALNYLSSEKVNSIYFLPMNLGGDGRETYPFVGAANNSFNKTHYDVSKLRQWNIVLNHAQEKGIALNVVLAETESGNENWFDNGSLGVERKLYYRELIARFGYLLALKWNLSEENDFSDSNLRAFADYIGALDWANHPLTFHIKPDQINRYNSVLGDDRFDTTSIQYNPNNANDFVETMRTRSGNNGRPWVIDLDENNPAGSGLTDSNANDLRKRTLYDTYFSGGNIEWYFGYHNLPLGGDMRTEDFRTRQDMYRYMWYARRFMQDNLPFWDMQPNDALLNGEDGAFGGGQVFFKAGEVYAVYLPDASPAGTLNVAQGTYKKRWFNPRTGLFVGAETSVNGNSIALGSPPDSAGQDWVVLLTSEGGSSVNEPPTGNFIAPADGQDFTTGESISVEVGAADSDGSVSNVRLFLNNQLVRQENSSPYRWGDTGQDPALQNLAQGSYDLRAVVTDNDGATGETNIGIIVNDLNTNLPPKVSFQEPANGAVVDEGTNLLVRVSASDDDGSVASVKLFINDELVREQNSAPYIWGDQNQDALLTNLSAGSYVLKAMATDDAGAVSETKINLMAGNSEEPITLTFTPSSDAYLDNGNRFNANILRVENNRRSTYLQFNVNGVSGSVTEVKLKMKVSGDPGNGNINIYQANGNNWNETNLNSQNAPAKGELLANRNGSWTDQVDYVFDVTSLLSTDGIVSLILEMDAGGNDTAFSSKEGGTAPELSVTYTPSGSSTPPIPATETLTPVSDAYLDNGNRYEASILRVENNRRTTYLKFDLTNAVDEINNMKLKLKVSGDAGNGKINIYHGINNNWNESNISADNAPTKGDLIGSRNGQWKEGSEYLLSLEEVPAIGEALSLIIEMEAGGNDTAFSSKEGMSPPELILNSAAQ